jgi:alkanesulfonate monooxygenase SsuD/methylene tetrahydromethanopterin reductase-like flavin-dependent oxidoreductase (luciferase family)
LHDTVWFEINGKPSVAIASSEFTEAAAAQAEALGMDAKRCFVRHPIQDRTDAEMVALAEEVVDEIIQALTGAR